MSFNKVILIGNAGQDPDITYGQDKEIVRANFSVATNERHRNSEGVVVKTTEWHKIVAWGAIAKIAERFIRKGSQILVEGKQKTRSYVHTYEQQYLTEVHADKIVLLKSGNANNDNDS